jgi:hypothetical protein
MSKEMEFTPYKILITLPGSHWEIVGVDVSSRVLLEGDVNQDEKLAFYRAPIR